jgi:hypothetical protein
LPQLLFAATAVCRNCCSLQLLLLLCLQPMMMPLLREMPEGQHGVRIMQRAVHATLFGECRDVCSFGLAHVR